MITKFESAKIVPVIVLNDENDAIPLAKILLENGMNCLEITFRTNAAVKSIQLLREKFPELFIGAGTILNANQADEAIQAGADFLVSPGFNPRTVDYCLSKNYTIIPGVNNPSLVEQALEKNLKMLKFFPAEYSGGVGMLKALGSVYPVKFMPTGGINLSNISDYLSLKNVAACGGSWMVLPELIAQKNWQKIAELTKEAVQKSHV